MKHGHSPLYGKRSPTYISWDTMIQRCTNPNNPNYKNYGGRGIRVLHSWMYFENFLADMGERPASMTLERQENNGDYEPGNCVWATRKTQQNNMRRNRLIRCYSGTKGEKNLAEWAEITGTPRATFYYRLKHGYSPKEVIFGKLI